ncbi:filamentous hemagglutinin N-terminal domain-containing protein [Gloeothece verrucosa]|uniref:Filamentous hemagglutinin family outer membrane protein n=1 Tax=Gloeothece verrucosa (strain PCC 7822) TaxID=497965 RepID=E0UG34_GLOV7|nr:S-layer family protein [Gloeothece verrucosa]ADN15535.1 filamentous hemagglutinin family outer membrane protein [Gloeothece verrucosa PCC 7822]
MKTLATLTISSSICLAWGVLFLDIAQGQIVPDTTLSNPTVVTVNGNRQEITGGTTVGNNLFHSFQQFSVPTNIEAAFNNNLNVVNIFSRVTGHSISTIDGIIKANGTANLFLINPNGILFGPNASLNIGGAFVASTANSIQWANNQEFSAVNPQDAPSLLTLNVPMGLQYGSNPGKIVVQGMGNNLELNLDNFEIIRNFRPVGLEVNPGQSLILAGGDIELQGGNITSQGGQIALTSVRNGQVGVINNNGTIKLSAPATSIEYGNIQLTGAASIDVSGNRGGDIDILGQNLILSDGSIILADTLGSYIGGNVTIKTHESLQVQGISPTGSIFSGIFTDVASNATGKGGNLTLETGRLQLTQGAQIGANTFGAGNAGTLTIKANQIDLIGESNLGGSGLFTVVTPLATGNGGNLSITTNNLSVVGGAQISVGTFGSGNAGILTVNASKIEIIGISSLFQNTPSSILANVENQATGKGGQIAITTNSLQLIDGGQIGTIVFGTGNSGILTIKASQIEIRGGTQANPSGLFTTVVPTGTGNGGVVNIETQSLRLVDGGQIAVSTAGTGNAGNLSIQADTIELLGTSEFGASGLFANALVGIGEGGNISLSSEQLILRDGATINISNFSSRNPNIPPGQGSPGNLNIRANSVSLDNQSTITAATVTGTGGNMTLSSQNLLLRQGSFITTNVSGEGKGGSITITSNHLDIQSNSGITANATGLGAAGNILIEANNINLNQGLISASGNQGNITLSSQNLIISNNSAITTQASGAGSGGNISITTANLALTENSDISANAVGIGSGGNVSIRTFSPLLLDQNSKITATGGQGNIFLQSPGVALRRQSNISTNGIGEAQGGNIVITANYLFAIPQENSDITANAQNSFGGRVIISSQGIFGLEVRPQLTPLSDITVSSQLGEEFGGVVQINNQGLDPRSALVKLPTQVIDTSNLVATGCPADQGNVFVVTGRGGLPENPNQTIQGQTLWQDLRTLSENNPQSSPSTPQISQNQPITEAEDWIIDINGRVTLISHNPNQKISVSSAQPSSCNLEGNQERKK